MFSQSKLRQIITGHQTTNQQQQPSKDNDFNLKQNLAELKIAMELRKTSNSRGKSSALFQQNNKITTIKAEQLNSVNDDNVSNDVDVEDLNIHQDNKMNYIVAGYAGIGEGVNMENDNKMLFNRISKTPIEIMNLQDYNFSYVKKPQKLQQHEDISQEADKEQADEEVEIYENSIDDNFHRAVGPRQCFSLMPVMGVLNATPKKLKFSVKSIQILVTVVFVCSSSILTLTMLKFLLKVGINAKNFVGLVFFSCVQCSSLLFISLAVRWPKIMRYWYDVEMIFTRKPYRMAKCNLSRRVRISASAIILLSLFEHILYLCSAVISYKRAIQLCTSVRNVTSEVSFEDYVIKNYDYVFQILPYNFFVGIFILCVNGSCTFIWNYMDLFIMMVSKGVAYRFEQITVRINRLANKDVCESVFIEIREHYVKLCELLEYIDENLSGIILLSCVNNLYFVCYQLLNIFNKLRWPINYIYFWFSLLYLIGRTAFVFLSAASINDESKGGLAVLRKVSNKTWCVEVERLIFQMTTQTVALSGKKFYYLTRRLLFGMAGTIVTYELVLLQFDEPNRAKGLPALCG